MNQYQQQRLKHSEPLILMHCQLMRRPCSDSTWQRLARQTRHALHRLSDRLGLRTQ